MSSDYYGGIAGEMAEFFDQWPETAKDVLGPPRPPGGGGARRPVRLREICCDCCPLDPTCEEENDFLRDVGLADEWGEENDVPAE